MAFCSNCGANVPEGTAFCPNCGKAIGSQGGSAPRSGGYKVDIQTRNIVTCVILSIVTCGIYGIVWFFYIVNDLNKAAQTPDDKSAGMIILLSIVTCGIYSWIWLYNAGQKVDKIQQLNGESPSSSSVIYLVLAIFGLGIVDYCLIQSELNKVAAVGA